MKKLIFRQGTTSSGPQIFKTALLLAFLLVTGLSGCHERECVEPIGFCGTGTGSGACDTYVTVRSSGCGTGLWGNLWLQLENGAYLQPWDGPQGLPAVTAGQRLKISYQVMKRDHRYDQVITCQALTPKADAIRITCFDTLPPACGTEATVVMDPCFPAYWGEVMLQLDKRRPAASLGRPGAEPAFAERPAREDRV